MNIQEEEKEAKPRQLHVRGQGWETAQAAFSLSLFLSLTLSFQGTLNPWPSSPQSVTQGEEKSSTPANRMLFPGIGTRFKESRRWL